MALFDRLRKKRYPVEQDVPQSNTAPTIPIAPPSEDEFFLLRGEVTRLYERGIDPLHAIKAMLYDRERNLITARMHNGLPEYG